MAKQELTQDQIDTLAREMVHGMNFGPIPQPVVVAKPLVSEDGVVTDAELIKGMQLKTYETGPVVDPEAWRASAGMLYRKTN